MIVEHRAELNKIFVKGLSNLVLLYNKHVQQIALSRVTINLYTHVMHHVVVIKREI